MEAGRTIKLGGKEGPSEEDTLRFEHRTLFLSKYIRANHTRHVQRP